LIKLVKAEIKIYRDDCEVTNEIYERGIKFKHLKVRPGYEESIHIIKFENSINKNSIRGLRNISQIDNNTILAITKSCSACKVMSLVNLLILSAEPSNNNSIVYTVLAKNDQLNDAIKKIKDNGLKVEILSKVTYENIDLSEKQIKAIITAYRMGYFCKDRKATLTQVAQKLNVKPSSLEDVLRRGLEKILSNYFLEQGLMDEEDIESNRC
jgi:predicted DNA binding protein